MLYFFLSRLSLDTVKLLVTVMTLRGTNHKSLPRFDGAGYSVEDVKERNQVCRTHETHRMIHAFPLEMVLNMEEVHLRKKNLLSYRVKADQNYSILRFLAT